MGDFIFIGAEHENDSKSYIDGLIKQYKFTL
jgi:hypothetical protein